MADLFDTRRVSEPDRMAFWLETVCENILPVDIDPRHDPRPQAAMSCTRVGALAMRDVVGGDHVYLREAAHVRRGDPESFQVGIPTKGSSMLIQDGREASLNPGDMVLWDSSRPYTVVMEDRFHWHVFLLPKQKLRRPDSELQRLTAIPIRGREGVRGVVSHFLLDLAVRGRALENDPSATALGETAGDLVAALVTSEFGCHWPLGKPDAVLRERVRQFIAEHHDDARLDPSAIAAAVGISPRTLHQLFIAEEDTVMAAMRRCRLVAIRRDLADPRLAHRSIGRIAAAHGLPNPTVFARVFKAEFGRTAREFRSTAAVS